MKTQILKAVDLCKSFADNGGQNHVLDMINLEIYKGDFTVIMGSSGAGKSTLLYTLSGMDTATNGKIYYKDKELNSYAEKQMADIRAKEFGFIFQQMHLISNLTLLENAAVGGYLGQKKSTNTDTCGTRKRSSAFPGVRRRGTACSDRPRDDE